LVGVAVSVPVGVTVAVAVTVAEAVAVRVAVSVRVAVGVPVGQEVGGRTVMTTCPSLALSKTSRNSNSTLVLPAKAILVPATGWSALTQKEATTKVPLGNGAETLRARK
jgi:hypothetical protein